MNYDHGFHAGNFADVHKHAVLVRILTHLREKPAAFRVLDTHAGAGRYDLAGEAASRTGEWRAGIGRLAAATLPVAAQALLAPYLAAAGVTPGAPPAVYPGSPALALSLLRPQDRLIACEAHPAAAAALAALLKRERRAKVIAIDGWTGLSAYIPPPERRGLVLVDPPYEQPDEFARAGERLIAAVRKWPTGIFMLWYPLKATPEPARLAARLRAAGLPKILRSELALPPPDPQRLAGSGLVVVNPPWRLAEELDVLAPALAEALAPAAGRHRLDWLAAP